MPSSENRVIIACAGSGKTTRLVDEALADRARRVAMVTYTNNNAREIAVKFGHRNSGVPAHVDVMTWFGFLLRECARPYQRAKYTGNRIDSILFVNKRSARGVREGDTRRHYFANDELIYSDKIAKFAVQCEAASSRSVSRRLGRIYTDVFIDEFQDLAGWDLEVIRMLLESSIQVTLVGDPRQHIYATNPSRKNTQYQGINVVNLVKKWERADLCSIEYMSASHRCNAPICVFANALWPGMDAMTPLRSDTTGHDGVFLVAKSLVSEYIARFQPQVLRHSRRERTYCSEALNFGLSKGLEFKRVLIIPTGPIKEYLSSGALSDIEKARDRLNVAVTRAWDSVAFVFDGYSPVVLNRWEP